MSNHHIFDDAEPPPSYEEAVAGPSNNNQRPPPTPPRPLHNSNNSTNNTKTNGAHNNPFNSPTTPTSPSASFFSSPTSPHTRPHPPAQTFQQILPPSHTVNRQFPPSFNLYRDAFPGSRAYFLGEHQATPLYAVTAWAGWSTRASLVLHNGPTSDHAPLATVAYDSWGRRMDVNLPPLPGRPAGPITVQTPGSMSAKFTFTMEVPWPAGAAAGGPVYHKESFEWRRSSSLAISSLGGRSQGWKLVRLSNELPAGGLTVAGAGPPSGDGHEVVAVCAHAVMSMTKLWKFAFAGTGISGVLGERWAIMAATTGLVIWDQESRGN